MSDIAAGFWPCKVLDGFFGDNDKNLPIVRINVELIDGPHKGMRQTYEELVNNKQGPYIARTCQAVGWRGVSMRTLKTDVADWIKSTGGISTVEIKHIEIKNGKKAGSVWAKPNSIGRGPKPLKEASQENLSDVDAIMRAALANDGGSQSGGAGGYDDAPPQQDDDIPFVTCSMRADRDPVTRSVRW